MTSHTRHFRIGAISVTLHTPCRIFMNEFLLLYGHYERASADERAIDVRIESKHRFPWRRGPYIIQSSGADDFVVWRRFEVLPHLEWMINAQIIRRRHEFVQLHSAAVVRGQDALVLPGTPGSGKSTLAAALIGRGWSYLCDEFALVDAESLLVHPFPRALCMKEPSFAVMDRLGLPLQRKTPYRKPTKGRVAFLNPLDVRSDIEGKPSPVRWVMFPQYVADATPSMTPITRAAAAYELVRQCFTFRVQQTIGMTCLTNLVRDAACYRLISSDIDETCDLVEATCAKETARRAG